MKHFRMLAAGLCSAVLLCGFAIPAYAYSDGGNEEPPVVEETPAPEPAPTITPGEGFSEDGNLVTRDLLYDAATNKQFITVETSGGNTFYIVIDYDKPVDEDGEQYVKEINSDLHSLQAEVGGDIGATYPYSDPVALVCNDEGKLIGLELNRRLRDENGEIYDIVAGTFLVVGLGEEDFASLSPELIQKYMEQFKTPERFMQINGNIVVLPVPAEKQDLAYLPDRFETGERIQTPRGSFQVTAMSREQMEAAGYGVHHISDDGKYLIMGNGTRAFAVATEQPEKDNPLRTVEMTLEDDYGMIDGVINNGRRGEELEKAQEYAERTTPEKPSIRERLEDAKRECAEHKPPEGKKPGRDVPEHDCL